jgi:hypothetical protein
LEPKQIFISTWTQGWVEIGKKVTGLIFLKLHRLSVGMSRNFRGSRSGGPKDNAPLFYLCLRIGGKTVNGNRMLEEEHDQGGK